MRPAQLRLGLWSRLPRNFPVSYDGRRTTYSCDDKLLLTKVVVRGCSPRTLHMTKCYCVVVPAVLARPSEPSSRTAVPSGISMGTYGPEVWSDVCVVVW